MRPVFQRIPPQIVVGIISGYLFCDTFDQALALFSPAFGVHPKWFDLAVYVLAPFIVALSIALALRVPRAWILAQAYLVIRILFRALVTILVPSTAWHYSSHIPTLPKGVSGPGFFVFLFVQLALNVLISVLLFILLRRQDVRDIFRVPHARSA